MIEAYSEERLDIPRLRVAEPVRAMFAREGFATAHLEDFSLSSAQMGQFKSLAQCWQSLDQDPYLPDTFGKRFRRHGRFLCDIKSSTISRLPQEGYFQSRSVNQVMGGINRVFSPLEERALENPLLEALLRANVHFFFGDDAGGSCLINVHFVRIPCDKNVQGYPCPEGIHRDGFRYISMHLINAQNIDGADSTLYDADENAIFSFKLTNALDSMYANDSMFQHYTSPFSPKGEVYRSSLATRDTLLASYERIS